MHCFYCPAFRRDAEPAKQCGAGVPDWKMVNYADGQPGCQYPAKAVRARLIARANNIDGGKIDG